MFPWESSVEEAGRLAEDGRKRRSSAQLPAARRRRPTSNWRPASGWAKRTAGGAANSQTPAHLAAQPIYSHGKVPMNNDGFMVRLGTQPGFRGRWYCGRILDPMDVPGASDQCGPEGGPQCKSCADFQKYYEPDLNDDGYAVKRSTSTKSCYNFYCGRPGVVAGTGGTCGPVDGPQCPSCQRLQQSFKAYYVNDEGCQLLRGTTQGYRGNYYCGRVLGVQAVPGSDGRCGPADGPQCGSCKRFQVSQQIIIDEEPKQCIPIEDGEAPKAVKKEPAAPRTTRRQAALRKVKEEPTPSPGPTPEVRRGRKAKAKTPGTPGSLMPASSPGSTMSSPSPSSPSRSPSRTRSVSRSGSPLIRQRVEVHETPNRTLCSECGKDNPAGLLMCGMMGRNCRIATHMRCCTPVMRKPPAGEWYCDVCRKNPQRPTLHCAVCGLGDRPEQLLLCDGGGKGCYRVTHLSCCIPALKEVPAGEWFCAVCAPAQGVAQRPPDVGLKGSGKGKATVYPNLGDALKVAAANRSPKASPKPRAKERQPRTLD